MIERMLRGTWLGVVVGVLSAIIAFLIAYNALIIQISNQKDDLAKAHEKIIAAAVNLEKESTGLRGEIAQLSAQYQALESRVVLIGKAKIYKDIDVTLPATDVEVQNLYLFLGRPGDRSENDKQLLYSYAIKSKVLDVRQKAYNAFAEAMSEKDWPAFIDLMHNADVLPYTHVINREKSIPCGDEMRIILAAQLQDLAKKSYQEAGKMLDPTKSAIDFLSRPSICFTSKEIGSLILIARKYNDEDAVARLNGAISKLK